MKNICVAIDLLYHILPISSIYYDSSSFIKISKVQTYKSGRQNKFNVLFNIVQ